MQATIVVALKLQKIGCETQPEKHLVIHLIPSGWISGKLIFGGQMVRSCSVKKKKKAAVVKLQTKSGNCLITAAATVCDVTDTGRSLP